MVPAALAAVVVAALLQLALPGAAASFGLAPNLVLALVVAWSWVRGPRWAVAWAVVGGLLLDLGGGGPLGVHATALLLAAYLLGLVRSLTARRAWALVVPLGALGGALYAAVVVVALRTFGSVPPTSLMALQVLGGSVASGGLLSVPFALLFVALRGAVAEQPAP